MRSPRPASPKWSTIYTLPFSIPFKVGPKSSVANVTDILFAAFTEPPFRCENEGWGEFDMTIDLYTTEKGGKNTLVHDLNFGKNRYEAKHSITFKNPSAALLNILRETGPVPGDENGARKKTDGEKKRKRAGGAVDMEKLADGLVKLGEDDLLHVVQMIHDNKSDETYTKNDIERKLSPYAEHSALDLIKRQRASFTSISTPSQTRWSRCYGNS
jgi:transcription initiation factor IIF auxiliary subunit